MKKHLINVWFDTPIGKYAFNGLINEIIGDNGKAIFYPNSLFKQVFGFELPEYSHIIWG